MRGESCLCTLSMDVGTLVYYLTIPIFHEKFKQTLTINDFFRNAEIKQKKIGLDFCVIEMLLKFIVYHLYQTFSEIMIHHRRQYFLDVFTKE